MAASENSRPSMISGRKSNVVVLASVTDAWVDVVKDRTSLSISSRISLSFRAGLMRAWGCGISFRRTSSLGHQTSKASLSSDSLSFESPSAPLMVEINFLTSSFSALSLETVLEVRAHRWVPNPKETHRHMYSVVAARARPLQSEAKSTRDSPVLDR